MCEQAISVRMNDLATSVSNGGEQQLIIYKYDNPFSHVHYMKLWGNCISGHRQPSYCFQPSPKMKTIITFKKCLLCTHYIATMHFDKASFEPQMLSIQQNY